MSGDLSEFEDFNKEGRSSLPTIAGVLLIVGGVIAVIGWIVIIIFSTSMTPFLSEYIKETNINGTVSTEQMIAQMTNLLMICGSIGSIFAIFMIVGGIASLIRKYWGFAVAGGILGMLSIGPYLISTICALIGLIMIIMSREKFN